jgi:hypothetical protein
MSETQAYFFAILTIGSLIHLLRESVLNPGPSSRDNTLDRKKRLSPIEVAYLSKEGDGGFALIVILLDVLHREVKDKITGGEIAITDKSQRSYELLLKEAAGGSLKDWSMRKLAKIESVVEASRKDPVKIVTKLPVIYKFMRKGVEGTVQELLRDPRNIKKLISVPGLMRLAADIGTSGYKVTLAQELKDQLTDTGFLASDETRHRSIKILLGTFASCQFILLSLILLTIPSHIQAFVIYFCGLFAALVVQACTGAREFIPLYSDLSRVLAQVESSNARIEIVRMVLKFVTIVLNTLSVIVFIVIFGGGSLFLHLTHAVNSITTYSMLIAQMLVQIIAFSYLFEAYNLHVGEMPTRGAKQYLAKLRKKYRQEETLPALKNMLGENSYNQDLSYLIALYGLETLLLI